MESTSRYSSEENLEKISGDWKPVRNRRTSPRKDYQHSERYSRNGPLSPLRSPLRLDTERNKGKSKGERRYSEGRRRLKELRDGRKDDDPSDDKLDPIKSITKQIEELEAKAAPAWGVVESIPSKIEHVNDAEYPTLDTKYTPEPRRALSTSASTTSSWASQVEEQEEKCKKANSSKRRLVMNATKPNSTSANKRTNYGRRSKPSGPPKAESDEQEADDSVIQRRAKQLQYGKNTDGYRRYTCGVTRSERSKNHPWTPDKAKKFSRRSWDMQVKIWRRQLHIWDPPNANGQDDASSVASSDLDVSSTAMEVESSCSASTANNSQECEDLGPSVSPLGSTTDEHPVIEVPVADAEFLDL